MTDTAPNLLDLSGLPPAVAAGVRQLVDTLRQATPPAPASRKSLRGSEAHLGLSIPPEHIAEAQRECWATMPPDEVES